MAKKKTTEATDTVVDSGNVQEVEMQKDNTESVETDTKKDEASAEDTAQDAKPETDAEGADTDKEEVETDKEKSETIVTAQDEIPAFALDYLKRHTEIQKVYIDKLGGVFSASTPKVFLKDAVLYQNPFYKS